MSPDICPLLMKALLNFTTKKTVVQNGFMRSGIYPWCPDAVDYSSLPSSALSDLSLSPGTPPESLETKLSLFESRLTVQQITEYRLQQDLLVWQGDTTDTSLFYFWRNLKIYCNRLNKLLSTVAREPIEVIQQMNKNLISDKQLVSMDSSDTENVFSRVCY